MFLYTPSSTTKSERRCFDCVFSLPPLDIDDDDDDESKMMLEIMSSIQSVVN